MGNHYYTIVPDKVDKQQADEVAEKIVNYLINKKIIAPNKSDCILSEDIGYPPGESYAQIVTLAQENFFEWRINGLEVKINRQVFPSNYLDEIKCPNCRGNIMVLDWSALIDEWDKKTENHNLVCPHCGHINSIIDFIFEPTWAFGELGFTFWNWGNEFKENFITDIENLIGHKVKVVFSRF